MICILIKPKLARCDNRKVLAKQHPYAGSPEDWFGNNLLRDSSFYGISFDFFVNWSNGTISHEVWDKRVIDSSVNNWLSLDKAFLYNEIRRLEGNDVVEGKVEFLIKNNLMLNYFLFKEKKSWRKTDEIIKIKMGVDENSTELTTVTIAELQILIQKLSGGGFNIGRKGLIYGNTTLECALSKTNSLWPGDADLLLLNKDLNCMAILEFKKHTLHSEIQSQALANYYPKPDGRKYNRLAILRDYLGEDIPIIIIYYPTNNKIEEYKFEIIGGNVGQLRTTQTLVKKLPKNSYEYNDVLKSLKSII